eukprot:112991_1
MAQRKRYWLVKLPKYVVDDWFSKDRPDESEIGHLEFSDTSDKSNHGLPQMKLRIQYHADPSLPDQFMLKVRPDPSEFGGSGSLKKGMVVFTEYPEQSKCKMESLLELTADAHPVPNAKYTAYLRNKTFRSQHNRSTTKPADEAPIGANFKTTIFKQQNRGIKRARVDSAVPERKRREVRYRMDEQELQNLICRTFDRQRYYKLPDLVKLTNQPQNYLKEVLAKICDYHREGDHRFMYSLKKSMWLHTDAEDATKKEEKGKKK